MRVPRCCSKACLSGADVVWPAHFRRRARDLSNERDRGQRQWREMYKPRATPWVIAHTDLRSCNTLLPSCNTLLPSCNTLLPSCNTLLPSCNTLLPSCNTLLPSCNTLLPSCNTLL